jgi:hypothetical protein
MLRLILRALPAVMMSGLVLGAENKGAEGVEVRFLAQAIPNDLGQVVLANAESRSAPFDLPMNNLSPAQEPPSRVFSVWSVDKDVSLAAVKLPEEGKEFICLLLIHPGKPGFSPIVFPANDPGFRAGDVRFFNLANKPVIGFLGSAKFALNPGKSAVVTPQGGEERFYRVGLGVKEAEGNRMIKTMKWPKSKQTRYYVFFYVDADKGRITYRAVDEFVIPKKDEE